MGSHKAITQPSNSKAAKHWLDSPDADLLLNVLQTIEQRRGQFHFFIAESPAQPAP
jgi:hypothetical protein